MSSVLQEARLHEDPGGNSIRASRLTWPSSDRAQRPISDFREAEFLKGHQAAEEVQASPFLVLNSPPSSVRRHRQVFEEAGFEWRAAGCSMCLAMNPDKLVGDQLCASSSNRNFKGRQGSPTGRTVLMSPVMVAAAAVTGSIADAREVFNVDPATAAA